SRSWKFTRCNKELARSTIAFVRRPFFGKVAEGITGNALAFDTAPSFYVAGTSIGLYGVGGGQAEVEATVPDAGGSIALDANSAALEWGCDFEPWAVEYHQQRIRF